MENQITLTILPFKHVPLLSDSHYIARGKIDSECRIHIFMFWPDFTDNIICPFDLGIGS